MRGWVRPGLAEMIDAPRLYTHERLPQGPRWSEVDLQLAPLFREADHTLQLQTLVNAISAQG
jgi:hypothetical protein